LKGWFGESARHSLAARGISTDCYKKGIGRKQGEIKLKFITGGDAVGREYHGYIAAIDPETGKIVGQVTYTYYNDKTYIRHIEVLPDYRRRGIGTALIKELKGEDPDIGMVGNYATEEGQAFLRQVAPEVLMSRGDPTYLYHGTTTGRFRDIRKEGLSLDPGFRNWADSEDFIYFTADEENVEPWAEHATRMYKEEYWDQPGDPPGRVTKSKPMLLRVKKEDLEEEDLIDDPMLEEPESDPNLPWASYLRNIPPEMIEVKTPTGWRRLRR